jgi:hypothetical protein
MKQMEQIKKQADFINLSFGLESSATLWNIVFEGFDQEVILISRFEGKDLAAIRILLRFGIILKEKYKDCQIEFTNLGLTIKKQFPKNDISLIREWSELMYDIREEMTSLIKNQ